MATIASVVRDRKAQLKQLLMASRRLDAQQERLEREVKRMVARKQGVPQVADAERLATMAQAVDGALSEMTTVISAVSTSWGSQ